LLIIAIAALVAGIVWIATKTTWFQDLWKTVWGVIQRPVEVVWTWIKTNWPLILGILTGPIGLAVVEIVKHWDTVVGFVKAIPDRIASAASGMWDGIKNSFKAVINWIIGAWNSIHLSLPSVDTHIPGIGKVGGFDLRVPQIPLLANGTDNWPGGPAIVNDGGPELLNLPRGTEVTPAGKTRALLNGAGGKGGGNVYIEHFHADGMSPQTIASALTFKLRTA
jgi:phage-related protein